MPNVLLFREPSTQDRYEQLFQDYPHYTAKSIPVLETVHCNIDSLSTHLLKDYDQFSGVIITSKRSCDTLHESLQCSQQEDGISKALAHWSTVPFYVVGNATSSSLRAVQSSFEQHGFRDIVIRGEASGTGEQLIRFIVQEHPKTAKPLLYLTGDKNRDTVPTLLSEGGIAFRSLQVYETQPRKDFGEILNDAIEALPTDMPWWVVYFAPSSAQFVVPYIQNHTRLQETRIAAIGPVTSVFLEKDLHIPVHVVSPNPKPEDLVDAILAYDASHPI
ncbi:tetrapyrrole biosynthesis, uroporphyrinogen III synthase [Coprinopsis sp. MPI-PUGE-AT-0042]|nr:tetrapyrrole biosynthesis, uroporphyrinogen III synthase [Coprinopsis sp. MPI-PUGE-AT-0042]